MTRAEHTTCAQRASYLRLRGSAMNAPGHSDGEASRIDSYASATGTVNANTHPSPGFEATVIVPPWASTIHFEM